jgi:hypothetical protein
MTKKPKKKLQPKKSVSIDELKKMAGHSMPPMRSSSERETNVICDECYFTPKKGDKIRFVRTSDRRIICEICFEKLDISDYEFVDKSEYDY